MKNKRLAKDTQWREVCILSDSLFPKKTNYVTKIHHIIIKSVAAALCCKRQQLGAQMDSS